MNNQEEQELLKREQEKQERIKREKFQGALNMPSLTRDAIDPTKQDDIEQHYNEDNRFPALAGGYTQDPLLMGEDYHDDFEQPIHDVEEGQLPSLPSLNNRRLS